MDTEMITYLIIGAIAGIIIGFILANTMSPRARKYNQVKRELEDTKQELTTQKQMIVKHFSHSAEILDNMAKDFRKLYHHMAENSNNLLSENDLNNPIYNNQGIEIQDEDGAISLPSEEISTLNKTEPPKDYSGSPSGLLKAKEEHKAP